MKINAIQNTIKYPKTPKNTIQKLKTQTLQQDTFQKSVSFCGYEEEYDKNLEFLKKDKSVKFLLENNLIDTSDLLSISCLKPDILKIYVKKLEDKEIFEHLSSGFLSMSDLEEVANFDENQMQQYKNLIKQNINPHQASFCVSYGMAEDFKKILESDTFASKMYKKGATDPVIFYANKYENKENPENFLKEVPLGYRIAYTKTDGEIGLVATKVANLQNGTKILKTITLLPSGEITKSTTQKDPDGSVESWHYDSDMASCMKVGGIATYTKAYAPDVEYQIEILNDNSGEPTKILYTHKSDLLSGVYEIEEFNLKDYPENFDIIKMIKNGEISGKKLATVEKNGNTTTFLEDFNYNDTNTKRKYVQTKDVDDNTISKTYQYKIQNNDGEALLDVNRTWEKISDTKTKTTINSKEYYGDFDDEKLLITIKDPNGEISEISIDDMLYIDDVEDYEELAQEFFEMMKTLPLDKILEIKDIIGWIYLVDDLESAFHPPARLDLGINPTSFYHEAMHSIDYIDNGVYKISEDKELVEIYKKELEEFLKKYPDAFKEVVDYFTPEPKGIILQNDDDFQENYIDDYFEEMDDEEDMNDDEESIKMLALKELVAESNIILSDYGERSNISYSRSQYLVWYFPKTIAKINELLNG